MKISIEFNPRLGFFGALTLLLIALKLMGYLQWSWIWVLSPFWISFLFVCFWVLILIFLNRN